MPDVDDVQGQSKSKEFYEDVPMETPGFFLKGSGSLDWGMKNRLSRIFNSQSGRTVMLAIDHGYFQGPTTGLERIDLNVVPLMPYADALMLTRGILRTTVPPAIQRGAGGEHRGRHPYERLGYHVTGVYRRGIRDA